MDRVVIIPVYNQLNLVQRCIQSVKAKTPGLKLIIVDDASPDDYTAAWLQENAGPLEYRLVRHDKSCGFSKSANDGIDYALDNYEFNCLCVLNSDTEIVTEDWFEQVENAILSGPLIGVAGVMSNNAGLQTVNREKYLKNIRIKPVVNCDIVHGFCLFLSLKLLQVNRHYNHEVFPNYASDYDFCMESLKKGFSNIVVGGVYVDHFGRASGIKDARKVANELFDKKWRHLFKIANSKTTMAMSWLKWDKGRKSC